MAWSKEQKANAAVIISVGRRLGASARDILIALMTAAQESGLRNLSYGDRDSVGLFQQRDAWGSYDQRTNPAEAARMFFLGGHGGQRGLLDIKNRESLSLTQAAQAVQVSAYPDAYAKWESSSRALMGSLGLNPNVGTASDSTIGRVPGLHALVKPSSLDPNADPSVAQQMGLDATNATDLGLGALGESDPLVNTSSGGPLDALEFDATPGSPAVNVQPEDPTKHLHLGGGLGQSVGSLMDLGGSDGGSDPFDLQMPTDVGGGADGWRKSVVNAAKKMLGVPYVWGGTSPTGVDCSGLVQLIYNQHGFKLPRISANQARSGQRIPYSQLRPGDLVAWDNSSRNVGADHIAIYAGNGLIIEAPRPGSHVRLTKLYGGGWGVRLRGGAEPEPAPRPKKTPRAHRAAAQATTAHAAAVRANRDL